MSLRSLQEGLNRAQTLGDCWALICRVSRDMNFQSITLNSAGGVLQERFSFSDDDDVCHFQVRFGPDSTLLLERRYRDCQTLASAAFLKIIRSSLQAKIAHRAAPPISSRRRRLGCSSALQLLQAGVARGDLASCRRHWESASGLGKKSMRYSSDPGPRCSRAALALRLSGFRISLFVVMVLLVSQVTAQDASSVNIEELALRVWAGMAAQGCTSKRL